MKAFLETTPGKILLIIIVLSIWGVNVINVRDLFSSDNETGIRKAQTNELVDPTLPEVAQFRYQPGNRNPFAPSAYRPEPLQRQARDVPNQIAKQKPILSLTGVMDGMAIIQYNNQESYFVAEGDTFENVIVHTITLDSVRVEWESEFMTLILSTNKNEP
ncbi:MAG: hypothetical protein AAFW89_12255 [Bacteroidota bacterium]